jgi:hypothetical protein
MWGNLHRDFGLTGGGLCVAFATFIKLNVIDMDLTKSGSGGFIQIPVLAIVVLVFTLAGITGGYYVTKQAKDTSSTMQSEKSIEEKPVIQQVQKPISQTQPKKPLVLDDYKLETDVPKDTADEEGDENTKNEKEFQEFRNKAEILIQQLETDKNNFQLLKDTISNHEDEISKHLEKLIDEWISVFEEQLYLMPNDYYSLFTNGKSQLNEHANLALELISKYYSLLDDNFLDRVTGKDYVLLIEEEQNNLKECLGLDDVTLKENLSLGTFDKKSCRGKLMLYGGISEHDTPKHINGITEDFIEIEEIVFDFIDKDIKSVGDIVENTIEQVKNLELNEKFSLLELENKISQTQFNIDKNITTEFQSIKCYATTNDSILKKNRTYSIRCEPYSQTLLEKCALQKARSVSTSGVYIGGQIDPECQ